MVAQAAQGVQRGSHNVAPSASHHLIVLRARYRNPPRRRPRPPGHLAPRRARTRRANRAARCSSREVDGEAWAALSIDDGHAVADPFRRSAGIVALLRARAGTPGRTRRGATRPALAPRWAA